MVSCTVSRYILLHLLTYVHTQRYQVTLGPHVTITCLALRHWYNLSQQCYAVNFRMDVQIANGNSQKVNGKWECRHCMTSLLHCFSTELAKRIEPKAYRFVLWWTRRTPLLNPEQLLHQLERSHSDAIQ